MTQIEFLQSGVFGLRFVPLLVGRLQDFRSKVRTFSVPLRKKLSESRSRFDGAFPMVPCVIVLHMAFLV